MNHVNGRNNNNKSLPLQTVAALTAAAQAAANINAQLAAEGKILPQQQSQNFNNQHLPSNEVVHKGDNKKKARPGRKDLHTAEVEINDLPPRVRNLLTKGYIQEQIQWKSKAALCTKGRYIPPKDKSTTVDERPLYICIQAVEQSAVDQAILQIRQFISEHTNSSPHQQGPNLPVSHHPAPPPPPPQIIKDKVYISLDHAPPEFKLVERVLGTNGDNMSYIQTETGVNVSLQGRGVADGNNPLASDEPLHLLLEHADQNAVQSARSLALSLVGTLAQDFVQWQREQQQQQQLVQQQHQQQFVYTFSQPYYGGNPTGGYHYPAVATMVYGHMADQQQHQTMTREAVGAPPSTARESQPSSSGPTKRPSRFDYQQQPAAGCFTEGSHTHRNGDHPSMPVKRPKMNHPTSYS